MGPEDEIVVLSEGGRLTRDLVRLVYQFLPITHGADEILRQLGDELKRAAVQGFEGDWGNIKLIKDQVILVPLKERDQS